jgi:hypothetical protein
MSPGKKMDFGVKRLPADENDARRYHLYDRSGRLVLVAEQGTPWMADDVPQRVRFAYSDGRTMATLDLPRSATRVGDKGARQIGYVLVVNHAVYAILNEYEWPPLATGAEQPRYYIIEVEGKLWLAQQHGSDPIFMLYDEVPPTLSTYGLSADDNLPDPIGRIRLLAPDTAEYDFRIDLPPDQMQHADLMVLTLAVLIDRKP